MSEWARNNGKLVNNQTTRAVLPYAALFAIFLALFVIDVNRIRGRDRVSDFRPFFHAAHAMRDGNDIYHLRTKQYYVYPPLIAFLYMPFTHMELHDAACTSLAINTLTMLLAACVGARTVAGRLMKADPAGDGEAEARCTPGHDVIAVIALGGVLLTYGRIRAELQMLQTDVFVLMAFVLALCWLDRRPILAGVALGFAFNIKYLTIAALPYLVLRRRFSAAISFVIATIIWALLPAAQVGLPAELHYLRYATSGLVHSLTPASTDDAREAHVHKVTDSLSVSVTSGIARTFSEWSMPPRAAVVAIGLTAGLCVMIVPGFSVDMASLFYGSRVEARLLQPYRALTAVEWAGVMLGVLAFSPDTNTRHLVLLLLFNLLGVAALLGLHRGRRDWRVAIALAMTFVALEPGPWGTAIETRWFLIGGQCWAALLSYLLLLAAVTNSLADRRPAPQHSSSARAGRSPSVLGL